VTMPGNPLNPVATLTATIAAELGEAVRGGEHDRALFAMTRPKIIVIGGGLAGL